MFSDNAPNRRFTATASAADIVIARRFEHGPFLLIRDRKVFDQMSQAEYDAFVLVVDSELVEISGQTGSTGLNQRGWKFIAACLPSSCNPLPSTTTFFVAFSADTAAAVRDYATPCTARGEWRPS